MGFTTEIEETVRSNFAADREQRVVEYRALEEKLKVIREEQKYSFHEEERRHKDRARDLVKTRTALQEMNDRLDRLDGSMLNQLEKERERADNAINRLMILAAQVLNPAHTIVSPLEQQKASAAAVMAHQAEMVKAQQQFNPFEELEPGDPEGYLPEDLAIDGYQETAREIKE